MTDDIDKLDETIEETERALEELEGDRERDGHGPGEGGQEPEDGVDTDDDAALFATDHGLDDGQQRDDVDDTDELVDEPQGPTASSRAFAAGRRVGDWVRDKVAGGTARFVTGFGSVVPFRTRLMRKLLYRSLYKYHRFQGGDAIGLRARPNGQIEPTAVKWVDALRPVDEVRDDSPSRPGWKVKGEERAFGAGPEGRNVDWLGRTPVILLDDDNPERFETLDARIADCLEDPDRVDAVFESAYINVTGLIDRRPSPDADGGGQAVADGGSAQVQDHYSVLFGEIARGKLKDKAIDVRSPDPFDGLRVSWRKVQEMRYELTTTEEMHNQEVRGWLAGKAGGNHDELVKRLALYFVLGMLGLLAIVFLGPALLTGDSVLPSLSLLPLPGGI